MPELPWEKWYPTNWASEPGLRLCEAATRGIWFEAINTMMLRQTDHVKGTVDQLASLCVCREPQMQLAVQQLRDFEVADVIEQNGIITIFNRRRKRACNISNLRRIAGQKSGQSRNKTPTNSQQHVGTLSASASASTSASGSSSVENEVHFQEIPSLRDCITQTMNAGIPAEFSTYVYEDWSSRGGRDAGSVVVAFLPYVTKRWAREQVEWRSKTHKGNRENGKSGGRVNPRNIGMFETADEKSAEVVAALKRRSQA